MDLSKLSLEEALKLGIITQDSWDNEDWDASDSEMEEYKNILDFAIQKHFNSNSTFITDFRTIESVPYIDLVKNILKILYNEAHVRDYQAWKTAALYNITVKTDCNISDLEKMVEHNVFVNVKALIIRNFESLEGYINRCIKVYEGMAQEAHMLVCVLLSAELAKMRMIKYPFESWEYDAPYYLSLTKQLKPFTEIFKNKNWDSAYILAKKLLEQIENNKTRSYNINKQLEELYASSCDNDGEWL